MTAILFATSPRICKRRENERSEWGLLFDMGVGQDSGGVGVTAAVGKADLFGDVEMILEREGCAESV
jgi:hypothetical protein